MIDQRSPIEMLGAILDEVEGLRRTDWRSFLPDAMIREAREVVGGHGLVSTDATAKQLRDVDELVGRSIVRVFDSDLKRGDVVLLCSDGGFVVLEAENDGERAYIYSCHSSDSIDAYLRPRAMREAGLISAAEADAAEKREQIETARRVIARHKRDMEAAQATLSRLGATLPEGSEA